MSDSINFETYPIAPFTQYDSWEPPMTPEDQLIDAGDPIARLAWKLMVAEAANAELREELDVATHSARIDEMTGLYKKNTFHEHTNELIEDGKTVVVMLLDLANFKQLNDEEGHEAGDLRIQEVAHILEYACTVADWFGRIGVPLDSVLSRLGGDEFGIAFAVDGMNLDEAQIQYLEECTATQDKIDEMRAEGIDEEQINYFMEYGFDPVMLAKIKRGLAPEEVAEVFYDIIQNIFHNHYMPSNDSPTPDQGVSIGFTVHGPNSNEDGQSSETLLSRADSAMYVDKEKQRETLGLGVYDRRASDRRTKERRSIFGRRRKDKIKVV